MIFLDIRHRGALRLAVGNVESGGFGGTARRADGFHGTIQCLWRAPIDNDMRSRVGERLGHLETQATSAAGDERDPAREGESVKYVHGSPLVFEIKIDLQQDIGLSQVIFAMAADETRLRTCVYFGRFDR